MFCALHFCFAQPPPLIAFGDSFSLLSSVRSVFAFCQFRFAGRRSDPSGSIVAFASLKRRLTVFVAELKTCCRNAFLSDCCTAMATRISQSVFYVLTPAIIAAKHLVSIGEGDAAFLALLFVLFVGSKLALFTLRKLYHVCFSCHSAFLPLLTRVISVPLADAISTDQSYQPGRSVPVTALATSNLSVTFPLPASMTVPL